VSSHSRRAAMRRSPLGGETVRQGFGLLDTFNRILVIIFAIVALGIAIALALQPGLAITWSQSITTTLQMMPLNTLENGAIITAICALVGLLIESRPRPTSSYYTAKLDGCAVEYAADLVADTIERDIVTIDGIHGAHAHICMRGQKVDVAVALDTVPGIATQKVVGPASERIRDAVKDLGLELGHLRLAITATRPGEVPSVPAAHSLV